MSIYFYMRISTAEEKELQSFQRQENALRAYAEENRIEFDEHFIYKDDKSGKNFSDRTNWKKLEKILKDGDTIVFKDLCRFTREYENGYKKFKELNDKNINLIFLDNPTLSTDYLKSMMATAEKMKNRIAKKQFENMIELLLLVELDRAEQEREITSKRIKDGIKASNKKQGRKLGQLDKITDELKRDIENYLKNRNIKAIDLMNKHNISRNTLKKYIARYENGQI